MTSPTNTPSNTSSRALSRRAALGLAAVAPLAALTGCSTASTRERLDSGIDRLRAPRSTPPAPANPDQPLVDGATKAIADMRASLLPHRGADAAIGDLVRLHAAHLEALGAGDAPGTPVTLGSGEVLAQAMAHERALGTTLATQAAKAHDGDLARLLAAMSAAVAQRTGASA